MSNRYGLEIRAAAGTEAAGLAGLLGEAGHVVSAQDVAARLEDIRAQGGIVLVALEWGPPSGVVAMHRYHSLVRARPVAQITALLVGEAARRKGIGRLLIKAAAQSARVAGCGMLEINAGDGQDGVRAFCLGTGFEQSGTVFSRALRKQGGG